ncbi:MULTISPECIES: YaaA family protein [unclassified Microbacterium]|uniref:YaaA family protein n=1 Tax=unclassified Microbacterium TaxID=2609290 RepID=UPI00386CB0CB
MLILLPPSETKRPGGDGPPLAIETLAYPELAPPRRRVTEALVALSADEDAAAKTLKLSVRQRGEVAANAELFTSPTLPSVDRYTGVLYDALGAASLHHDAREWIGHHVAIHSAPFGPVGGLDPLPAYRLGAGIALPGVPPLRRVWADAVAAALAASAPPFILDLRSEAYVALGPVPSAVASAYVRVVTAGPDGSVRALNHFNKHAKGDLVRRLASDAPAVRGAGDLLAWAEASGVVLRAREADSELELVV